MSNILLDNIKSNSTVTIPDGDHYIGYTKIKDIENLTLIFSPKTKILGYEDPKKWKWSGDENEALITFYKCKNIKIYTEDKSCKGIIDGQGESWWNKIDNRPSLMIVDQCEKVEIYNLELRNSPFYNLRIFDTNDMVVHDLKIIAPKDSPNTDGVNITQGVNDFEAYNLDISSGDDGFAVNSMYNPTSRISFHDSKINYGHGVAIGSGIYDTLDDVKFYNLKIKDCDYGLRIKAKTKPTATTTFKNAKLTNVSYKNIKIRRAIKVPILITTFYAKEYNKYVKFDNISYEDVKSTGSVYGPKFIFTSKSQLLSPILIDNVSITGIQKPGEDVKYYPDIEGDKNASFKLKGKNVNIPYKTNN